MHNPMTIVQLSLLYVVNTPLAPTPKLCFGVLMQRSPRREFGIFCTERRDGQRGAAAHLPSLIVSLRWAIL